MGHLSFGVPLMVDGIFTVGGPAAALHLSTELLLIAAVVIVVVVGRQVDHGVIGAAVGHSSEMIGGRGQALARRQRLSGRNTPGWHTNFELRITANTADVFLTSS